jgi:hypothetical protein
MFTNKEKLWCKERKGYINYTETQNFLSELHKGNALKKVKFDRHIAQVEAKLGVCATTQVEAIGFQGKSS